MGSSGFVVGKCKWGLGWAQYEVHVCIYVHMHACMYLCVWVFINTHKCIKLILGPCDNSSMVVSLKAEQQRKKPQEDVIGQVKSHLASRHLTLLMCALVCLVQC